MTTHNSNLIYEWSVYTYGNGICIDSVHKLEGPWATLTVNLIDYGMQPEENHVFVPIYKMSKEFYEEFLELFAESVKPFKFGPYECECLDVTLKPDWQDGVHRK